jgi:hypothetical protein
LIPPYGGSNPPAPANQFNSPRLQVRSAEEYVDLMNNMRLGNPKMMDVAIPANMRQGLAQERIAQRGWAYTAEQGKALIGSRDVALVDWREKCERERHGEIPGAHCRPPPRHPWATSSGSGSTPVPPQLRAEMAGVEGCRCLNRMHP